MNKFISILVPTYNRVEYLKQCLASLEQQTDNDFLVLISNNGSTDGTKEWLDIWSGKTNLNVVVNHNRDNFGPLHNVETTVAMAKKYQSEWLSFVCDDDWVESDFIKIFKDTLQSTKASLVVCNAKTVDEAGNIKEISNNKQFFLNPAESLLNFFNKKVEINIAGISGFCFRSNNFIGLARFPKGYHDDTWLVIEQAGFSGIESIEECVYIRRRWSGSESGRVYSSLREFIKISYADFLFRNRLRLLCERILSLHPAIEDEIKKNIVNLALLYTKDNFATLLFKHKIKKLFKVIVGIVWKK